MGQPSVFSVRDRRMLREMLTGLIRPVGVMAFVEEEQEGPVKALLAEVEALSRGVVGARVERAGDALGALLSVTQIPSFRFVGVGGDILPIEMVGLPTGYQFGAFLALLTSLSRGRPTLSHGVVGALKNLTHNVYLEVLVTATCPNCPQVVRLAQQFALANPARIHMASVDALQCPDPMGIDRVPWTRLFVDGVMKSERAGMVSAPDLFRWVQTTVRGGAAS